MTTTSPRNLNFSIRVSEGMYERLEALQDKMAAANAFATVRFSHVLLRVFAAGLPVAEGQGPAPGTGSPSKKHFAVRLPEEMYERLEVIRLRLLGLAPYSLVTISHAARLVLELGLPLVEAQENKGWSATAGGKKAGTKR